jgi:hypothetical protein
LPAGARVTRRRDAVILAGHFDDEARN